MVFFAEQGGASMTAPEPTDEFAAAKRAKTVALVVRKRGAEADALTPEEQAEFERALRRIERFPREFGWLMIYVGVLGIVLPGVIGFPLVIAGGAVLMPGGRQWLVRRWSSRQPGRLVRASLKQIVRMADDLDRRYPALPKASS
jgi:hypothetical protein